MSLPLIPSMSTSCTTTGRVPLLHRSLVGYGCRFVATSVANQAQLLPDLPPPHTVGTLLKQGVWRHLIIANSFRRNHCQHHLAPPDALLAHLEQRLPRLTIQTQGKSDLTQAITCTERIQHILGGHAIALG